MLLRRPLLLAVLLALVAAPVATARPAASGIELANGSGRAALALRGAVLGVVERGRVTVKVTGAQTTWKVDGYEWSRRLRGGAMLYGGEAVRFRLFRGQWRLVIQGIGINASAAGRGTVTLRGTGTYSLSGGASRPWPRLAQTLRLDGERAGRAGR